MAVAFDAKGTAYVYSTSDITDFTNLTIGSGANRALLAFVIDTYAAVTSITWDYGGANQAMSLIDATYDAAANVGRTLYGLVNPVSGAKTLRVVGSGFIGKIDAISFTGAHQTTPFDNMAKATGSSSALSVTVTSATGNMVVGFFAIKNRNISLTSDTNIFMNTAGEYPGAGANYANGAASVSLTANGSGSGAWCATGLNVASAPPVVGMVFPRRTNPRVNTLLRM